MRRSLLLCLFLPALHLACGGDDPDGGLDPSGADGGSSDLGPGGPDGYVFGRVLLSTDAANFGKVLLSSSDTLKFTISNPNLKPVRVTLSTPSGAGADRFTRKLNVLDENGAFVLEASGIVTVTLQVTPVVEGALEAGLQIESCDGACPLNIPLLAEGVRSAIECVSPYDYGLVNLGACKDASLSCTNAGNVTETVTSVELSPTSAASFRLSEPVLPIVLEPGASTELSTRYCPSNAGDEIGQLQLLTFLPFETEHLIDLLGKAGGPDVACAPSPLTFGEVGLGANVSATLVCENRGVEIAHLSLMVAAGAEFSLAVAPGQPIDPGASVSIDVAFAPTSAGEKNDLLFINSDDPDSPMMTIPIQGTAIEVGPCSARLLPNVIDFGLVGLGEGRALPIYVENFGSDPCLIRRLDLGVGASADFSFRNGPPVGSSILPGERQQFEVVFTPSSNAAASGAVVVSFSNPGTTELTLRLDGTGGGTAVLPEPGYLDFGTVPASCAAPIYRRLRLRWLGGARGEISNVDIVATSTSVFPIRPGTVLPSDLGLGDSFELDVGFLPTGAGNFQGALRVFAGGVPTPVIVPLYGQGGGTVAKSEDFAVTAAKVDVLFVVDDSATMVLAQDGLATAMSSFDQLIVDREADVHLGFTTTDMEDPLRQGRLYGTPRVLDSNTPGRRAQLIARALVGTGGSGDEQGILAATSALSAPLIDTDNVGFLRPDADLAIVIVSDEDDHSPVTPTVLQQLLTARQASGTGVLLVAGVVAPPLAGCIGPYGSAPPAPRYAQYFSRAGGEAGLYCGDMSEALYQIGDRILSPSSYVLGGTPAQSSIHVSVDGIEVPREPTPGAPNWAYELAGNRVVFLHPELVAVGAVVNVSYDLRCTSTSCGDLNVDAGEQCDLAQPSAACTVDCFDAVCGDGDNTPGEQCDDGNLSEHDQCPAACQTARCGDGYLLTGVEECDDGNVTPGDGCPAACRFYVSGGLVAQTFTPLSAPIALLPAGGQDPNDDGVASINLPFSFSFYDVPTTSVSVSVNGFLSFLAIDKASSYENDAIPSELEPNGYVAPWWYDLYLDPAVPGGADISYQVLGAAPNRVLVVEWRNLRPQDHRTASHRRFTFQAALYEGSNAIELRYATTQVAGAAPTAVTTTAGIEDQTGSKGVEALGCSPLCDGRARPARVDGFPENMAVRLTP